MQEMMNDTAGLITEDNIRETLPDALPDSEQPEEEGKSEFEKLKEELSAVTYDDILNNTAPYEKILALPDEFAISQYITAFRQIAKKFKLTADFDSLVAPYKEKALSLKKQSIRKRKRIKASTRSGGTEHRSTKMYSARSFFHSTRCTASTVCSMT